MPVNAFGFERSIPGDNGDCKRCECAPAMDDSDYCPGCAAHLAALTA